MFGIPMHKVLTTILACALAATIAACGQASEPAGGAAPPRPAEDVAPPPPTAGHGQAAPAPMPLPAPAPAPPAVPANPAPRPIGPTAAPVACASAKLAPFPWPNPPQPSVFTQISFDQLFPEGAANKSLLDVGRRLSGAIASAGYHQTTYLGAGCNGFAIILDLEHIDADGTRQRGADGFAPPGQQPDFNLASFLVRLFHAPPGYYRQIVFVVSDEARGAAAAPPSESALRRLAEDGASALPPSYAGIPLSWQFKVIAAVYEFRKGAENGDAQFIPPSGRLGAAVHLIKARLL